jgi:DNA-binding CsgD family transcriptional regulator
MRSAHGSIITVNGVVRACGMSAFVHANVLDAAIANPMPLLTKRLLLSDAATLGRSSFLNEKDIARGNTRDGLHLLIMQANLDASAGDGDILFGQLTRAFYRQHEGYRLVRVVADYVGPVGVAAARSGEFEIICEFTSIAPGINIPSALAVVTPERAAARSNTTTQAFVYTPPRILFTAREQALLRCAVDGSPDEAIAARLGVGLSSVKARWTRVQQRAVRMAPELFRAVPLPKLSNRRGAQTRHLLLEYVRANPSELTPYFRDATRTSAPQRATPCAGSAVAPPRERRRLDAEADTEPEAALSSSDLER